MGIRTYYPYIGGREPSGEPRRGPSTLVVAVVGYGIVVVGAVGLFLLARV